MQLCQACGNPRPANAILPVQTKPDSGSSTSQPLTEVKEDDGDTLAFADEDILFYQLRSRATKALCKLLTYPGKYTWLLFVLPC